MNLAELTDKLSEIKRVGYIVSLRRGNTGIGYTLESLLELKENNLNSPDLGAIEIKSQRNGVSNRVTMFTFNRGVWKLKQKCLIEKYGYVDTNERHSLYCTVNSSPNNQGLYLKVEEESVRLKHVDGTLIAQWSGEVLIGTFKKKMPALVLVLADTRLNSDLKEEFWFNEAYILSNPDTYVFLDLIRKDIIVADLGMYVQENGAVRNRGVQVRIEDRFLNLCFGTREKII